MKTRYWRFLIILQISISLTVIAQIAIGDDAKMLPIQFEASSALPGEGGYPFEMMATIDTAAFRDYRNSSTLAFPISKGQRVIGLDGVVVTAKPGRVRVLKTCPVGGSMANPKDIIYTLYHSGEGWMHAWFRGRKIEINPYEPEACFKEEEEPVYRWFVKILNAQGRQGWVKPDNFLFSQSESSGIPDMLEADWLSLGPGQSIFNYTYTADGRILYEKSTPLGNKVFSEGTWLLPKRILVSGQFPDLKGNLVYLSHYVIACERESDNSSCNAIYKINTEGGDKLINGRNVWFSSQFVVILDTNNGTLYRVDMRSGESRRLQFLNQRTDYTPGRVINKVALSEDKQQLIFEMTQNCLEFQAGCRSEPKTSHVMSVNVATWEAREVSKQTTPEWSNDTGHKHAETPQQRAIVAAALNFSEKSPQSIATGIAVIWETDTEGGDGKRMRDAIQVVYDYWIQSGRTSLPFVAPLPTSVQKEMRARLRATHSPTEQSEFITQITSVFNGTLPSTDNETLRYLGIRAQCKEFADHIVQAGGGKTHTYSEGKALAVNPEDIRPGMYAFKKDSSHAAIIVAVKWNANGQPTDLRLAEANWGKGWTNPNGQVPWKRVVSKTREVPVTDYYVVPTD